MVPKEQFQFNKLPMGLKTAPHTFQKGMYEMIRSITKIYIYLDDVLIATENEEEHIITLDRVFKEFYKNKVRINFENQNLCKKK